MFLRIDLSTYVVLQGIVKNMFKTRSYGLCFSEKDHITGLTLSRVEKRSVSKAFYRRCSIPLVTPRKFFVLESLYSKFAYLFFGKATTDFIYSHIIN